MSRKIHKKFVSSPKVKMDKRSCLSKLIVLFFCEDQVCESRVQSRVWQMEGHCKTLNDLEDKANRKGDESKILLPEFQRLLGFSKISIFCAWWQTQFQLLFGIRKMSSHFLFAWRPLCIFRKFEFRLRRQKVSFAPECIQLDSAQEVFKVRKTF